MQPKQTLKKKAGNVESPVSQLFGGKETLLQMMRVGNNYF